MNKKIGIITENIVKLLKLDKNYSRDILIGDSNINHIKIKHLDTFEKYGSEIPYIIKYPTFVARNEKKDSIEYIKEYKTDNEHVLIAVRVSRK